MGEYINHELLGKVDEIKVAVCHGDEPSSWSVFFSREALNFLKILGFKDYYCGQFSDGNLATEFIDSIIHSYDEVNNYGEDAETNVRYGDLVNISIKGSDHDVRKAVNELILDNIAFLAPVNQDIHVISDLKFTSRIKRIAVENRVTVMITPAQKLVPQTVETAGC